MDREEATALAETVRQALPSVRVEVSDDDEDLTVEVFTTEGHFTLWDEQDWTWLKDRITGTGSDAM